MEPHELVRELSNDKHKPDAEKIGEYLCRHLEIGSIGKTFWKYSVPEGIRNPISSKTLQIQTLHLIKEYRNVSISKRMLDDVIHFVGLYSENLEDCMEERGNYINFDDKILDLDHDELREYCMTDMQFHKLPYKSSCLAENKQPERWISFLHEILEGYNDIDGIINLLQEYIGHLLTGDTTLEKGLLLYGRGGNGKGVLLETIKHIIGQSNCSHVPMRELAQGKNVHLLQNKLANIDTDADNNIQLDKSIFKKIISGETITAKKVYQDGELFKPYARLLLATNSLPKLVNRGKDTRRRYIFLELKNTFSEETKDTTLKLKLIEEVPHIIARAYQGLRRLKERKDFLIPIELTKGLTEYINSQDVVQQYLSSELVIIEENVFDTSASVYASFKSFCENNGYGKAITQNAFSRELTYKGFNRFKTSEGRMIKGIKVR